MTSIPYPIFEGGVPRSSYGPLSAVGRCRITSKGIDPSFYGEVLETCRKHAGIMEHDESVQEEVRQKSKKEKKALYKASVKMWSDFFRDECGLDVSIVDVEVCLPSSDVLATDGALACAMLDAGASHAVLDDAAAAAAVRVDKSRIVARVDSSEVASAKNWAGIVVAIGGGLRSAKGNENHKVGSGSGDDVVGAVELPAGEATPEAVAALKDIEGPGLYIGVIDPTPTQLGMAAAACFRTDRDDGLYTTVVCTRNGEALGLVYSSKSSIVASLEGRRAVYYSRSRKGLWRKGDTSGCHQTLHRIDVDCDGDALRFTVTQHGEPSPAFCHLGDLTCWKTTIGLRNLQETLRDRFHNPPVEGSYTEKLFRDETLLRDKLVEEAQELSEAKDSDPLHVAEELADVLYFAMVRATKAGVTLDDAARVLNGRARKVTRRKGDRKQHRIDAAAAILHKDG